jgi:exopolysaccharide production protein ExoZ
MTQKLSLIQFLRALAASLVIVDHALDQLMTSGDLQKSDALLQFAWLCGWTGVALFFVISGLVMVKTTGADWGSAPAARRFLASRAIRIVPLYWIATGLLLVSRLRGGTFPSLSAIVCSLAFIPYYSRDDAAFRPLIGVGWTLNYEMFFYAIFALCLMFSRGHGRLLLLAGLSLLVAAGLARRAYGLPDDAPAAFEFYLSPLLAMFGFGALIGIYLERRAPPFGPFAAYGVALLSLALIPALYIAAGLQFPLSDGAQLVFGALCALVVFALATPARAGPLARLAVAAGDASYSTYLFHNYALSYGYKLLPTAPVDCHAPLVFLPVCVIAANLLGWCLHRLIERPLTRALRNLAGLEPRGV